MIVVADLRALDLAVAAVVAARRLGEATLARVPRLHVAVVREVRVRDVPAAVPGDHVAVVARLARLTHAITQLARA